MRKVESVLLGAVVLLFGTASDCSRERVESMNKMNEGVLLAQQKRHLESVKELERATAIDPTNEQAFYNLALVQIEMRNFNRAKDDLKRAIALNDSVAGYYEKLGTILIELEDWQGAKAAFEGSIERDPSLFKAYYKLAQVYEQLDDPQHALEQYTKAIQMGPRFLEAYSQLGRLYANLGYLNEGVQVLRGALEVAQSGSAEAANVHHLLGTVYQQQGNLDEAVNQFKAALTIEPGMTDALFSLGWTYALQNNKEEASRFLKKFLDVGTGKAPEHYIKAARDRLAELESTI